MEDLKTKRISCSCEGCQNACSYKPGWFKFGEIEKVANYLKISLKELFDNYLAVDWYKDLFVLAPVLINEEPGGMYPYNPKGECIFFEKNKCKIHAVAPYECQQYYHDENINFVRERHRDVAQTWMGKEKYIKNYLGYEPYIKNDDGSLSIFNMLY